MYILQNSHTQLETILECIRSGKKGGAKLECDGDQVDDKGYFTRPTIFTNVKDDMKIAGEEVRFFFSFLHFIEIVFFYLEYLLVSTYFPISRSIGYIQQQHRNSYLHWNRNHWLNNTNSLGSM